MTCKHYNELQWNEQNKARRKATTTHMNFANLHDTLNQPRECKNDLFEEQRNGVTPK